MQGQPMMEQEQAPILHPRSKISFISKRVYVSSSWLHRLQISECLISVATQTSNFRMSYHRGYTDFNRKFVNHTTEMILWSMILIMMTKNCSKKIVFSFRSKSLIFHPISLIFSSREAEFYGRTDQSIKNGLKSVVWSKINLVHWATTRWQSRL